VHIGSPLFVATRIASRGGFTVDGLRLPYFRIRYFRPDVGVWSWHTERVVEMRLVERFVRGRAGKGLEVGNVMARYLDGPERVVVDKYEQSPGVLNVDVMDYWPGVTFDWIVACSTLEHVGWDESCVEPDKALRALDHLRTLLSLGGRLFVTWPLGYHPSIDAAVLHGDLAPEWSVTFRRTPLNRWVQTTVSHMGQPDYDHDRGRARTIWVGEFGP
jgi:hypothetical protein